MVRFFPPQLARLITIGLQARVHQDGLAPTALSMPNVGASAAVGVVTPAGPLGTATGPTGYRRSSRGIGRMPPKQHTYNAPVAGGERVPLEEALRRLSDGNKRFVTKKAETFEKWSARNLEAPSTFEQNPMASVIGCADSQAPVELVFDAAPGDVLDCRRPGSIVSSAAGSMLGRAELSVTALGVKLVVFLGHTHCGATAGLPQAGQQSEEPRPCGVTARYLDTLTFQQSEELRPSGVTAMYLDSLKRTGGSIHRGVSNSVPAEMTRADTTASTTDEANVFDGIEKLLLGSESIRQKVKSGQVQVHGAIFDTDTGEVKFLGQHPRLPEILDMSSPHMSGQ